MLKNPALKKNFLSVLGPGLITGASDDDPSGIATYSQVGAHFGLGMLWTMLFSYPLMTAVQEISGRIGRVTGHGIAANIRRHYPAWLLQLIVWLLFIANTLNLGADLGAMGSCLALFVGGNALFYTGALAMCCVTLEIFIPYTLYVRYLKWLTLVLFSYVATAMIAHVPFKQTLQSTFLPHILMNKKYLTSLIAVLGTTISPYLVFWQASEEAEEVVDHRGEHPLKRSPEEAPGQLKRIRIDTYVGMAFSNLVAFFIILATAATLNAHGITEIATAQQAAQALEPVAGHLAFLLFSLGIIGTGLLAVPVLAGSSAYALGEAFRWRIGLERKLFRAKAFYGVIFLSTGIGFMLNLLKINTIKALFWSAVINGAVSVPVLAIMMWIACDRTIMGDFVISPYLRTVGWLTTGLMLAVAVVMLLY